MDTEHEDMIEEQEMLVDNAKKQEQVMIKQVVVEGIEVTIEVEVVVVHEIEDVIGDRYYGKDFKILHAFCSVFL